MSLTQQLRQREAERTERIKIDYRQLCQVAAEGGAADLDRAEEILAAAAKSADEFERDANIVARAAALQRKLSVLKPKTDLAVRTCESLWSRHYGDGQHRRSQNPAHVFSPPEIEKWNAATGDIEARQMAEKELADLRYKHGELLDA